MLPFDTTPRRSLASIRPGETLHVITVMFDSVRERCAALGMRPGEPVHCLTATVTHLHLQTSSGAAVMERVWAGFVEVGALAADTLQIGNACTA